MRATWFCWSLAPSWGPDGSQRAMMALSLMARYDDVRLAERTAHSPSFMGTKWIDLWVVYEIFAQARVRRGSTFTLTAGCKTTESRG